MALAGPQLSGWRSSAGPLGPNRLFSCSFGKKFVGFDFLLGSGSARLGSTKEIKLVSRNGSC